MAPMAANSHPPGFCDHRVWIAAVRLWGPVILLARYPRHFVAILTGLLLLNGCDSDPGYGGRNSSDWIEQLHSPDPKLRRTAAEALEKVLQVNPDSRKVVDALTLAIRDTSDEVRLAAADALTTEGVNPARALAGFHAAMHDSAHPAMRAATTALIGTLGHKRGRILIPHVLEVLNDADASVRTAAIESLGMLGPDSLIDPRSIASKILDPDPVVRRSVLPTLVSLHAAPSVVVSAARTALRDSSASVRMAGAYTFASLNAEAAPALTQLRAALRDADPLVRMGAANAIGSIGAAARVAVPDLIALERDSSLGVITQARRAIEAISAKGQAPAYTEPSQQQKCAFNHRVAGC